MTRARLVFLATILVLPVRADDKKNVVTVEQSKTHIDFRDGELLVARYHIGPEVAKPYFYPLTAPGGLKVTRGVPPPKGETSDHPHQKSAWFCHGDVIPEGIELERKVPNVKGVDFWSEHPNHGKMVCVKATTPEAKGEAVVVSHNEWQTPEGVKILDEDRTIRLRPAESGYLFVLEIDLHASVCPLTFGDTKEGSFGVRVPDSMTEKKGKGTLTNAEGKTGMKAIWGQRSKWSDYSGEVEADGGTQQAGVTIFDHPKNPVPACWHSRDYGLMAANPFGRASFPGSRDEKELVKLSKGEHLKLRYGLYVHKGDVKDGKVASVYETFVNLRLSESRK
jgi:hypothetical protein